METPRHPDFDKELKDQHEIERRRAYQMIEEADQKMGKYFWSIARITENISMPIIIDTGAEVLVYKNDWNDQDELREAYKNDSYSKPMLVLKDLSKLTNLLSQFQNICLNRDPKESNKWYQEQRPRDLFLNASSHDLLHPDKYLERLIAESGDTSFEQFPEWTSATKISSLGEKLFFKHGTPTWDFESAHELQFSYSDKNTPDNSDMLPIIRYGRPSESELTIYAIQMPKIEQYSAKGIKENLEKNIDSAKSITASVKNAFNEQPQKFKEIFGEVPEEIITLTDPSEFTVKFYNYLKELAKSSGIADVISWGFEQRMVNDLSNKYFNTPLQYMISYIQKTAEIIMKKEEYEKILNEFETRSEKLKQFNQTIKGKVPSKLRATPPAGLISLAIASKMFQQDGVKTVYVPIEYPLRFHRDNPQLDEAMAKQKILLMNRLAFEIEGVEISEINEKESYITLKFTSDLQSSRPFLQEALESVNYSPYPKPE